MATTPGSPQRAYRAACPNCGAPVEFASAASASAVCSFCRSTLIRDGEALLRIGTSAELFDDHSPLQLGAGGTFQGSAFTLVGRLQYGYEGGTWNEWHALFDTGKSGWLSEDNGAYVMAFDAPAPPRDVPSLDTLTAGQRIAVEGRAWDVASVVKAHLIAAQERTAAAAAAARRLPRRRPAPRRRRSGHARRQRPRPARLVDRRAGAAVGAGDERPRERAEGEDARRARHPVPQLRQPARSQARQHEEHHLRPVQRGGRPLGRRRRRAFRTTRKTPARAARSRRSLWAAWAR
ncbi:MAG: DUF4178 domain-containing protein [Rubrivivax sp.]